jgi:hypothetical protein
MKVQAAQGVADLKTRAYAHGDQIKIYYEQHDPHLSQRGQAAKKWFQAKITSINPDGTYNIRHIAGSARQTFNVPIHRLKKAHICDQFSQFWCVTARYT